MSVEALHECSLKVTCFSPEPYVLSYTGMTGTVINAAKRHLAEGRIPTPESKTANQ